MNFLITGGCGYIGTNLTKYLLNKGHKVIIVDNLWFGNNLKKNKNLKIIKEYVRNFDKLKITKLAQGLPVGGEIEQLDDGTLFSAFKNRAPISKD